MTPAERLLAAADLLDKRAGEATAGPWRLDGPWWWSEGTCAAMVTAQESRRAVVMATVDAGDANAAYIATMHPGVGKHLVEWLREEAAEAAIYKGVKPEHLFRFALGLADLLLASQCPVVSHHGGDS